MQPDQNWCKLCFAVPFWGKQRKVDERIGQLVRRTLAKELRRIRNQYSNGRAIARACVISLLGCGVPPRWPGRGRRKEDRREPG